jgi:type II secretory pathway component GspD/PulD (secretin)
MNRCSTYRFITFFVTLWFATIGAAGAQMPERVSLAFDRVPVMQFVEATFRGLLGAQYVIDPALVDDSRRITIHVKDLPRDEVRPFVVELLAGSGVAVEQRGGIDYLMPRRAAPVPVVDASFVPVSSVKPHGVELPPVPGALAERPELSKVAPIAADHVEIYSPRWRSSEQLQTIANSLLGSGYKDPDAVILSGSKERVAMVRKLLEDYDERPREVVVRAVLYEYTDSENSGFNFQAVVSALSDKLNISLGPATVLQSFVGFRNTTLNAVVSAVSGDSRFRLVSSPTVRVRHAARARLTVGTETPVLDAVKLDNNGNAVQSVTYRPSGVILDLVPTVLADRVELAVTQELSSFTTTQTSNINSPTLLKRSLATTVSVEGSEIIVLGGLDEDKSTDSRNGFSFLPPFMRSTSSDELKTQILLVMEVQKV